MSLSGVLLIGFSVFNPLNKFPPPRSLLAPQVVQWEVRNFYYVRQMTQHLPASLGNPLFLIKARMQVSYHSYSISARIKARQGLFTSIACRSPAFLQEFLGCTEDDLPEGEDSWARTRY